MGTVMRTPQQQKKKYPPTEIPTPIPNENSNNNSNNNTTNEPPLTDFPQEVTWLFFRDNQWTPFQNENHLKIEQAFTMGGKGNEQIG